MKRDYDDRTVSGGKGQELSQFVNLIEQATQLGNTIKAQMESRIEGGDYAAIGGDYGVSGGNSEPTYNLVAGAVATLNGDSALVQLVKRLG